MPTLGNGIADLGHQIGDEQCRRREQNEQWEYEKRMPHEERRWAGRQWMFGLVTRPEELGSATY